MLMIKSVSELWVLISLKISIQTSLLSEKNENLLQALLLKSLNITFYERSLRVTVTIAESIITKS